MEFVVLTEAVKRGDLRAFNEALEKEEVRFIRNGTYLVLERVSEDLLLLYLLLFMVFVLGHIVFKGIYDNPLNTTSKLYIIFHSMHFGMEEVNLAFLFLSSDA